MERPNWSEVFTADELADALAIHAVLLAKHFGGYSLAADVKLAAECIRDLSDRLEQAAIGAEAIRTKLVAFEKEVDTARALVSRLQS